MRTTPNAARRRGVLPSDPDPALCQGIAAGDQAAFEVLFQRHMKAIWNYAHRLTGSWSEAEDLTSATFLTAWRRRDQFRVVNDSALPWLYTVARNMARTHHRGRRRFLKALPLLAEPDDERDHADEVSARIDDDRQVRRVREALPRLPAAEREAVELCLLAGLTAAEASVVLGRAEASIRSRLSRAKSRLRTILGVQS
ncbi:RNA polymerase sigma factor [Labedaea rhizosphaerae]|uniref:RNA polymerase sigma-70 factor (ECF subfamily) n=1 Tax=Labedaea rhizosphaerae TaxID=598644 RepID=A0A4R6SBG3_LABRH|nr:RNA polymerase sigma factor [Labedaea rhizosphaerae]TDP97280.1 RNA polymerase sigma-70 factor (ECF subfamily) [Labedaea rhizosphaerae]